MSPNGDGVQGRERIYMIETEILIIGGGIAGASTAYHLAQYGRHVTLLERSNIACEASGVNAGALEPSVGACSEPNRT
jgi:glycerol-3-phosphate dehydrogenase